MSSNVVILGKAGTNETYIPFSLNDGGVLYTDQAPNSNAGIIQGRDLNQGGVDFGVLLDGMGINQNALPTCSRLYATNPISGAIQPVGINTDGELIVSGGGGGGGGGVVEGIDTTSGEAVNISATNAGLNVNLLGVDTIGAGTLVGLATTIINETINTNMYAYDTTLASGVALTAEVNALTDINKLYTRANLFVNQEDNAPVELPLNCDADGYLNVNVKAGGGGGGIVQGKVIATGLGADITAEVNAISGINSLYSHSSIYGKDPISELEKQVEVNTEGQISVLVKNPNPIQTEVSNDVIVSPIVESLLYDVVLNADLYGDSQGSNDPPFQADPRGRHNGWFYQNTDNTKGSNVYYYINNPINPFTGSTIQSNIDLGDVNYFYSVITIDYIGPNRSANLPILVMGSQPLSLNNPNDHIENFANTVYTYNIPNTESLILGETILIYYSQNPLNMPPDTYQPGVRRIRLVESSVSGPETSNLLGYLSINTQTAFQNLVNYTLLNSGYQFTGSNTLFDAEFTAKTPIENNLNTLTFTNLDELLVSSKSLTQAEDSGGGGIVSVRATDNRLLTNTNIVDAVNPARKLVVNEDGSINVAGGGGGGGGGVVQLQAYSSIDGTTPVNVEATANRLLVDSNIVDSVNPARKLVVNEDGSINVAGSSSVIQGIDTTSLLPVNIGATDTRLLTNSLLVSSTGIPMTTTTVAGGKEGLDVAIISNSSIIQGLDTATDVNVNIKATDNRLLTNSLLIGQTAGATPTQHPVITDGTGHLIVEAKAHDGGNNPIDSTVVGTDRGLDVYILGNNPNLKGSYNNVANDILFLNSLTSTTPLSLNNEYGNESVISYQDSSTSITSFISIYGSLDTANNGNYFYIGVLQPVVIRATLRQASAVLKLKGLKWLIITNEHTSSVSNVKCSVFSGE